MRYLIDFEDTVSQTEIDEYFATNSCEVVSTYNLFDKVYLVNSSSQPPLDSKVTSVIADEQTIVMPQTYDDNTTVTIDITSEGEWWKTISIENLDFSQPEVTINRRGLKSCVYVMDSGINSSHPEFVDADVTHLYSFNGDIADYNGHGTAIASVISGATCGMTSAKLVSVKIFQSGVPTYQSHLLAALDAIASHHDARPNQFSIVNMSWAISKNEYIESKIRTLINRNVLIVCAAGNSGAQIENTTPAGMPETFTIGAFNRDLEPCDFSNLPSAIYNTNSTVNYGPLFYWAPGEHIRAAVENGYDYVAGTSISAAIASAAIAYNSWTFLKPDGSVPTRLRNNPSSLMSRSGASYGGVLNLTGEYENTTNTIAKFSVYKLGETLGIFLPANNLKVAVKSGERFDLQLISPIYSDQIVQIDSLPDGVIQNENFLEGVINTDTYFVRVIPFTVTMRNGLISDHNVFLYVTAPEYSLEMIPEEDRILDLRVLTSQCCTNAGAPFYGCIDGFDCNICEDCGDASKGTPNCVNQCSQPCGTQICP